MIMLMMTIVMTSIAITSITAIPMLMTTSRLPADRIS
jgi:hypothetical protein